MEKSLTSYDEVPYESQPFAFSHPDHLATIATLLHLAPQAVGSCRVLELGCASGNNIIPMAYLNPGSSFVGIDQSAKQIEQGLRLIKDVHLANIELKQLDLRDLDDNLGLFDYIICHGTLSWVPADVQERILELCSAHLAPQGIAYISYNTYPGWHIRSVIRDMLIFHSQQFEEAKTRITESKKIAGFYAKAVRSVDSAETAFLRSAMSAVDKLPDWYLFHDLIERDNYPVYFSDFVKQAEAHNLRYLTDADVVSLLPQELPPEVHKELQRISPDPIRYQQYLDFVRVRLFRHSLLCQAKTPAQRLFDVQRVKLLCAASALRPEDNSQAASIVSQTKKFIAQDGSALETSDLMLQRAILRLTGVFPRALPFAELLSGVESDLTPAEKKSSSGVPLKDRLSAAILRCYLAGFVKLSVCPPKPASAISQKPAAYEYARRQAEGCLSVTNLWHELIELDELTRDVLVLLDGSRDLEELRDKLRTLISDKGYTSKQPGEINVELVLEQTLNNLAKAALLVS
jgi:SAM-dependent methyltransferase